MQTGCPAAAAPPSPLMRAQEAPPTRPPLTAPAVIPAGFTAPPAVSMPSAPAGNDNRSAAMPAGSRRSPAGRAGGRAWPTAALIAASVRLRVEDPGGTLLRIGHDHRQPQRRGPGADLRPHLPRFAGQGADRGRSVHQSAARDSRPADLLRSDAGRGAGGDPPAGPVATARWPRRAIALQRGSRWSASAATTAASRPPGTAK